jgi:malonate transporter and related proteins
MSAALLLLPDFALILIGASLRRVLHLGDHFWSGAEKLVYFVLFPAMLFNGLVRTHIDWAGAGPLLAVAAACMAAGMVLGAGARLLASSPRQFASLHQCAFRFNSYIALAIAASLHGPAGVALMAIVVGVMVPPANLVAVWMLARGSEQNVLREVARNPLVLGTLAGLAANLAGLSLPEPALKLLGRLGDAAVALGLLSVGAGLRLRGREHGHEHGPRPGHAGATNSTQVSAGNTAIHGYLLAVKLIALPALIWALAHWLGLPPLASDIVFLFAALPTASSAFILAQRMGGDGAAVAWQISVGTLLAMVSIPMWLALRAW